MASRPCFATPSLPPFSHLSSRRRLFRAAPCLPSNFKHTAGLSPPPCRCCSTRSVCLEVLETVRREAEARQAGVLFLGEPIQGGPWQGRCNCNALVLLASLCGSHALPAVPAAAMRPGGASPWAAAIDTGQEALGFLLPCPTKARLQPSSTGSLRSPALPPAAATPTRRHLAGDFWHMRGALPVEPLNDVVWALAAWRCPTLMLVGNHDQVRPTLVCHCLLLFPVP